jgi:hypothetical protein
MKTQTIQNVFKMMIGTSALIASTAFFINTISPVQASENNLPTTENINTPIGNPTDIYVGCGNGIYQGWVDGHGFLSWKKVGP